MKDNTRIQSILANNMMWGEINDNSRNIGLHLLGKPHDADIGVLMFYALKLVVSEQVLNREKYERYTPKNYTDEDYIDLVIESIFQEVPNINDTKENNIYIEEIREVMWGHMKNNIKSIIDLLKKIHSELENYRVSEEDVKILMECLTVIYVESVLRKREAQMLSNDFKA